MSLQIESPHTRALLICHYEGLEKFQQCFVVYTRTCVRHRDREGAFRAGATPTWSARRGLSRGVDDVAHQIDRHLLDLRGCWRGDSAWPETTIKLTLSSGKTTRTPLRKPVPVYAFYWIAFVNEQGQIQFRRAVYGWDAKLPKLMGLRIMRFDLDSSSLSRA
jgi:hypothetical protein